MLQYKKSCCIIIMFMNIMIASPIKKLEGQTMTHGYPQPPFHFFQAIQQAQQKLRFHNHLVQSFLSSNKSLEMFDLAEHMVNKIEEKSVQMSEDCEDHLKVWTNALKKKKMWALSVIDAFGKPPSGLLSGNVQWRGEYSECINTTEPYSDWHGKYCSISKPTDPSNPLSFSLQWGICVPHTCSNADLAQLINSTFSYIPFINFTGIPETYINCQDAKEIDGLATFALVLFSILLFLVTSGTLYDFYLIHAVANGTKNIKQIEVKENDSNVNSDIKEEIATSTTTRSHKAYLIQPRQDSTRIEKSKLLKALLNFSIYTNTVKLFKVSNSDDQLACINAIRFLSIGWVILGHTYVFLLAYVDNIVAIGPIIQRFSFMLLNSAFFSVDSFFFLSGLLTCYLFMKEVKEKNRPITVGLMFKYYVHRLWRITPPYALVILFSVALSRYLGSGPNYPRDGFEINFCRDTWWTNLLYVNNLVNLDKGACLGVSWYLANDMQFHWIAPIMIVPFALNKKWLGYFISIVFLAGHILATALIVNHYPGAELGTLGGNPDYFNKIYVTPWCRIGPFIVGILFGYQIYTDRKNKTKLHPVHNKLLWLGTLITLALMVFGVYDNFNGGPPLNKVINILYQATSRTVWSLGLGFIVYACLTGQGGIFNKFFSLSIWTPLSRLSFSAYLIHSTILFAYYASQDHAIHLQDSLIVYLYIGNMVLAFCAAYFVSMIFEVPIISLDKFIFKH